MMTILGRKSLIYPELRREGVPEPVLLFQSASRFSASLVGYPRQWALA